MLAYCRDYSLHCGAVLNVNAVGHTYKYNIESVMFNTTVVAVYVLHGCR